MAKVTNNPKDKMRMNIELADNGIIIRNPENEDEVTLALSKDVEDSCIRNRFEDIYKAIGKKIYNWLLWDIIDERKKDFIITNFDIDVVATCKGRAFNE